MQLSVGSQRRELRLAPNIVSGFGFQLRSQFGVGDEDLRHLDHLNLKSPVALLGLVDGPAKHLLKRLGKGGLSLFHATLHRHAGHTSPQFSQAEVRQHPSYLVRPRSGVEVEHQGCRLGAYNSKDDEPFEPKWNSIRTFLSHLKATLFL